MKIMKGIIKMNVALLVAYFVFICGMTGATIHTGTPCGSSKTSNKIQARGSRQSSSDFIQQAVNALRSSINQLAEQDRLLRSALVNFVNGLTYLQSSNSPDLDIPYGTLQRVVGDLEALTSQLTTVDSQLRSSVQNLISQLQSGSGGNNIRIAISNTFSVTQRLQQVLQLLNRELVGLRGVTKNQRIINAIAYVSNTRILMVYKALQPLINILGELVNQV